MATPQVENYDMAEYVNQNVKNAREAGKSSKNVANLSNIISVLMDQANAIIIAVIFYHQGQNLYFWMTLLLVGINLLVLLICSILRKVLEKDEHKVRLLKLYEAFIGCAPQAILQLSIISMEAQKKAYREPRDILMFVMALRMVLLMAAALTDYHETILHFQHDCRYVFSRLEVFTHFTSSLGALISRMYAIIFFGVMEPWITLGICGGHGILMACWVTFLRRRDPTNAHKSFLHKFLVNVTVGFAYILHYFKVIQRSDKLVVFTYFLILHAESAVMMTIWFLKTPDYIWVRTHAFCTFWVCLGVSLLALAIYYARCHSRMMKELASVDTVPHEMEDLTKDYKSKGKSKSSHK